MILLQYNTGIVEKKRKDLKDDAYTSLYAKKPPASAGGYHNHLPIVEYSTSNLFENWFWNKFTL